MTTAALDEILYFALAIAHGGESAAADCLQVGQPKDALVEITQGPGAGVAPGPDLTGGTTRSMHTTMNGSLHHLAHSPYLRVMAWLAWLILVVNPVYGAPLDMMHGVHSPTSPVAQGAQFSDHCHPAASAKADRSSGGDHDIGCKDVGHVCHCVATCCGLLPTAMADFAPTMLSSILWPSRPAAAPRSSSSPPLRPPRTI